MTTIDLSFVIRFDGSIVNSPRGVEYFGGSYVQVPLTGRINFQQLIDICGSAITSAVGPVEISKIYFRVPHFQGEQIYSYSLMDVQGDPHVCAIQTEACRMPALRFLELYVEYRKAVVEDISIDQLHISASSESERDSEEEGEHDHYETEVENMEDILIAAELGNTVYQSRLPAHVRRVDLEDFDVDLDSWEKQKVEWERGMEFEEGMTFSSRDAVRACAVTYSVDNGREFQSCRTTLKTLVLVCKHKEICPWWLRATLLKKTNTWTLTKYIGPHICDMQVSVRHHRNFGIAQIANYIKTQVLGQRDIRIKTLIAGLLEFTGVALLYKRVWYGKERAISSVYGDWEYNYSQLTKFMDNVVKVNPGSFWHGEGPISECGGLQCRIFERMFWTFFPMVDEFPFCKPILFIDGTHLYGKFKMHMLIASAIDGNNHIMPVAFALVESESIASFEYFLGHLRDQVLRNRKVAIVSDRAPGLISVLRRPEWDDVDQFFCIRHLMANFHSLIGNRELKDLAEKAGRAFQEKKYNACIESMRIRSAEGHAYLTNTEHLRPEQWTMCHDKKGQRNGVMTTNYAESVNAMLKNIRGLPITAMIEAIFDKLSDTFVRRWDMYKDLIAKGVMFTPICIAHIKKATLKARYHSCKKYNSDNMTCRVTTKKDNQRNKGGNIQKVNLKKRRCSCGKFQHRKLPCSHAMAVIHDQKLNPHDFIRWRYRTENAIQVWNTPFKQLPDGKMWIASREIPFIPDVNRIRAKGRPVNRRIRNDMDQTYREDSSPNFCSMEAPLHSPRRHHLRLIQYLRTSPLTVVPLLPPFSHHPRHRHLQPSSTEDYLKRTCPILKRLQ
ncbi:uncharacterized protein LOC126683191 isoform X2 [Mercurialis annua]|nr:uncharacterized protein LOC126683191 isoform X2 [Mercurialis annua]